MADFKDIKTIWSSSQPNEPEVNQALKTFLQSYRKNQRHKSIRMLAFVITLFVLLIFLLGFTNYELWTTPVGLSVFLIITCYVAYLKLNKQRDTTPDVLNNQTFLNRLEQEKNETCVGKAKRQSTLFILYGVGFAFFIFETVSKSTASFIIGYGALITYLLAVRFFYMPMMNKRFQKNAQSAIEKINKIKTQFSYEDEK